MNDAKCLALFGVLLLAGHSATAEIVSASDTHFVLRLEAESSLAPGELWRRLANPAAWWHPDHTYSGDAGNLALDVTAGGLWREDWEGGSVLHGRVLFAKPERSLRLEAPFGPLQGSGAYTVWTITLTPTDAGTRVVFDERAIAPDGADLESLARAVDAVKSEAINRLIDPQP